MTYDICINLAQYSTWTYLVTYKRNKFRFRNFNIFYTLYVFRRKGQCHEMNNFWRLNILNSIFCVCADGFQGLSKVFTTLPYTIITFSFASLKFLTHFENAYWNHPQVPTSHWLQENAQKLTCGFRYDFTESQAVSCKHFSV